MTLYTDLVDRCLTPEALEDGECWEWERGKTTGGYGVVRRTGDKTSDTTRLVHREAYLIANGEIEAGLQIDHICHNRKCYRPSHLRAVTQRENLLASNSLNITRAFSEQTHCKRGHEFTPENTITRTNPNGRLGRECRTCAYAGRKRRREARKEV